MSIPVFLSYPKPHMKCQENFITQLTAKLIEKSLEPRTMGVSDYDMDAPLVGIRRLLTESNGLISIAFRRTLIIDGEYKAKSDTGATSYKIANQWYTSPFCQIEPSMAFQIGLPVLIFREKDVIADGILERGVLGTYMPEFDSMNTSSYFDTIEWKQLIDKWERQVKMVHDNRGNPPKLY